jgi:hypothetical protein
MDLEKVRSYQFISQAKAISQVGIEKNVEGTLGAHGNFFRRTCFRNLHILKIIFILQSFNNPDRLIIDYLAVVHLV